MRLGGLAGLGLEHQVLTQIAKQLEEPELAALKGAFQRQADRALGLETQLSYAGRGDDGQELDGAFLI